jgi:hypothetical protein
MVLMAPDKPNTIPIDPVACSFNPARWDFQFSSLPLMLIGWMNVPWQLGVSMSLYQLPAQASPSTDELVCWLRLQRPLQGSMEPDFCWFQLEGWSLLLSSLLEIVNHLSTPLLYSGLCTELLVWPYFWYQRWQSMDIVIHGHSCQLQYPTSHRTRNWHSHGTSMRYSK